MIDFIKEYPRAIASLIISAVIYYGAGKIPQDLISPENVEYARVFLSGIFIILFGRYTRLTKTEATELSNSDETNFIKN